MSGARADAMSRLSGLVGRRQLRALGGPLLLAALIGACGGSARQGAPSLTDTAGASPNDAGSSSVGATAGVAGSEGQGIAGSSSSGGSTPACLDSLAATGLSICDFNHYAFDPASGYCGYLTKAKCGVTSNRFETLEACIAACDPGGLGHCRAAGDCVVRSAACCGECEPVKAEDLRALNRNYADLDTCAGVPCRACAGYDSDSERRYYGARCMNQQCQLFDVRSTEIARCESDGDCVLREGLECCECASAGPWVAISTQTILALNFLGCAPGTCPVCDHTPSGDLRASCVDGRCVVSNLDR